MKSVSRGMETALLAPSARTTTPRGRKLIPTGTRISVRAGKFTEPVQMSWTSDNDPRSGTMTATLPDRTYSGPFFEITQQTRGDSLTSLWNGWGKGWVDWSYWTSTPDEEYSVSHFVTQYSGKVVANLSAADGSGMRCRFHLTNPASGMAGGGAGECQIKGSETIQARF